VSTLHFLGLDTLVRLPHPQRFTTCVLEDLTGVVLIGAAVNCLGATVSRESLFVRKLEQDGEH